MRHDARIDEPGERPAGIPIACSLSNAELREWSEGIGGTVLCKYEELRELPDGYVLRYPGDAHWARTLLTFILHERACCPFFRFGLIFEPDNGAIWLQLTGDAEVKTVVEALLPDADLPVAPSPAAR